MIFTRSFGGNFVVDRDLRRATNGKKMKKKKKKGERNTYTENRPRDFSFSGLSAIITISLVNPRVLHSTDYYVSLTSRRFSANTALRGSRFALIPGAKGVVLLNFHDAKALRRFSVFLFYFFLLRPLHRNTNDEPSFLMQRFSLESFRFISCILLDSVFVSDPPLNLPLVKNGDAQRELILQRFRT